LFDTIFSPTFLDYLWLLHRRGWLVGHLYPGHKLHWSARRAYPFNSALSLFCELNLAYTIK